MHLKIVQIHSFYDSYISQFYNINRGLSLLSYQKQIFTFLKDAYGCVHIYTPYLKNCKAQLIISNCAQTQSAWAREHGIALKAWNAREERSLLLKQMDEINPDVLYIPDCIRYDGTFIHELKHKPRLVIGWRAADVPTTTDWNGFDVILSSLPGVLALATGLGAQKSIWFAPGMPEWVARAVEEIEQDTDVVFVGGISPTQHVRRLQFLHRLAEAATRFGFSLRLYLSCDPRLITPAMRPYVHPPVFGLAMHRALRRGKIVFDVQGTIGLLRPDGSYALDLARGHTANMRLFEGTGGGSLVLTDALQGLSELFEPETEIATFSNEQEMIEKILFYISHEANRISVANAGKKRCLNQWNMKNRAAAFMDIVKQYF